MAREQFGELSPAELQMLRLAPTRDVAWGSPSQDPSAAINDPARAASWGDERAIRAAMIEWLVSDSAASRLIHPSGIAIKGARITGKLDFSFLTITVPVMLVICAINDGIDLRYAHYQSLDLQGSFVADIDGDQSVGTGDFDLRQGRYGEVSLYRAEIGGNLDTSGGQFIGAMPISAIDSTIKGDALFHEDFTTSGMVDFRLARVGRSLSFNHAHFIGTGINGLNAERAAIDGTLYWVDIGLTGRTRLDLSDARVDSVWDDPKSWPAPGNLTLDGLIYRSFSGGPEDSESRLAWLLRQPLAQQRQAQPYRQLAEVLRAEGRPEGAIRAEMAREDALTRFGNFGISGRIWRLALDAIIGYGYRPLRALWWILGFVTFGACLFRAGYRQRVITPTEERAYEAFARTGEPPLHYPPFSSVIYSLENFLPIVELHQGQYWRPNPRHCSAEPSGERVTDRLLARSLRWYLWIHILAGWTITPLLFAGLAGLLRND
jgi:hypothetical protein